MSPGSLLSVYNVNYPTWGPDKSQLSESQYLSGQASPDALRPGVYQRMCFIVNLLFNREVSAVKFEK